MGPEVCSWCGSEDTCALIGVPFCYFHSAIMKIKKFLVLQFKKCSKWKAGSRPWKSRQVWLPSQACTWKWVKSSPVWRKHHQQSVLKDDGAEWLLSPAIMVQYEQQYKACMQPKQSLQLCHLYDISEYFLRWSNCKGWCLKFLWEKCY